MLSPPYLKTSYLRHVWRPGRKRITYSHRTRYFRSLCLKSLLLILITVCLILTTFAGRFWISTINAMSPSVTMTILYQLFLLQTLTIISAGDLSNEEASWSMTNSLNYKYTPKNKWRVLWKLYCKKRWFYVTLMSWNNKNNVARVNFCYN